MSNSQKSPGLVPVVPPIPPGLNWGYQKKILQGRTCVLRILSRIELVNNLVALLSIDFHALETDVRKEMMLRSKVGNTSGDSVLISNLNIGPALEFERSDATRRLRLVLSELLAIMGQVN